jgi:hypothetical protein
MYLDFKELLSVFNAHGVKYLIVGGYAVSFHAQPRATKDLDLSSNQIPRTRRRSTIPWPRSGSTGRVSA